MASDHEQLRLDIVRQAAQILASCRQLAYEEEDGEGKAKYKQLGEYAELVMEQAEWARFRPPTFVGRLD